MLILPQTLFTPASELGTPQQLHQPGGPATAPPRVGPPAQHRHHQAEHQGRLPGRLWAAAPAPEQQPGGLGLPGGHDPTGDRGPGPGRLLAFILYYILYFKVIDCLKVSFCHVLNYDISH